MAKRKAVKIQPGMQVRVGRNEHHGIKFGAICRVLEIYPDGDCKVDGPLISDDWCTYQYVDQSLCSPIKKVRV